MPDGIHSPQVISVLQHYPQPPPRMPFPPAAQQQVPINFMQPYGAPAPVVHPVYHQSPVQLPRPKHPPQRAGRAFSSKPACDMKILSLIDPNTGEDITEKVFTLPATEGLNMNEQEIQVRVNTV